MGAPSASDLDVSRCWDRWAGPAPFILASIDQASWFKRSVLVLPAEATVRGVQESVLQPRCKPLMTLSFHFVTNKMEQLVYKLPSRSNVVLSCLSLPFDFSDFFYLYCLNHQLVIQKIQVLPGTQVNDLDVIWHVPESVQVSCAVFR